mmetsp:Transcript_7313/g.14764  ORF Transcript_7313/g.14764 Transcript_7313/m.14764 type:complete len:95 (-) Transcript_7313:2743-3027(-)
MIFMIEFGIFPSRSTFAVKVTVLCCTPPMAFNGSSTQTVCAEPKMDSAFFGCVLTVLGVSEEIITTLLPSSFFQMTLLLQSRREISLLKLLVVK